MSVATKARSNVIAQLRERRDRERAAGMRPVVFMVSPDVQRALLAELAELLAGQSVQLPLMVWGLPVEVCESFPFGGIEVGVEDRDPVRAGLRKSAPAFVTSPGVTLGTYLAADFELIANLRKYHTDLGSLIEHAIRRFRSPAPVHPNNPLTVAPKSSAIVTGPTGGEDLRVVWSETLPAGATVSDRDTTIDTELREWQLITHTSQPIWHLPGAAFISRCGYRWEGEDFRRREYWRGLPQSVFSHPVCRQCWTIADQAMLPPRTRGDDPASQKGGPWFRAHTDKTGATFAAEPPDRDDQKSEPHPKVLDGDTSVPSESDDRT